MPPSRQGASKASKKLTPERQLSDAVRRQTKAANRVKKVTTSADNRNRRPIVADAAFALILRGAGYNNVPVKFTTPPPQSGAALVYRRYLDNFLYHLPTSLKDDRLPVGDGTKTHPRHPPTQLGLLSIVGFVGNKGLPNYVETIKAEGLVPERLWAPDGDQQVIWLAVPDWARAGPAMKLASMCAVAADPAMNGVPMTINLSPELFEEARAKGFGAFLQRRLRRYLKPVLPEADFAFVPDCKPGSDKPSGEQIHLHGVLIPNQPFSWSRCKGRDHLYAALRRFARNPSASAVAQHNWNNVPEGWGGYSAKYAAITAEITDAKRMLITSRGLTRLAEQHWKGQRAKNLADMLEFARLDVADQGKDPIAVVALPPPERQRWLSGLRDQLGHTYAQDRELSAAARAIIQNAKPPARQEREPGVPE